jgi:hypothetical protein
MGPITKIVPRPKEVQLGERTWTVGEARILDFADIQAWLDCQTPDPLDDLEENPPSDDEERRVRLVAAYERLTDGCLVEGTPAADDALFGTAEGAVFFLYVALVRYQPEITAEDCLDILMEMTDHQFRKLRRVFFGVDSLEEISKQLLGPAPRRGLRKITWGEVIDQLSSDRGWTYPQIYDMTLTELVNARTGGKPVNAGMRPIGANEDPDAARREQYRRYHGKDLPDSAPAGVGPASGVEKVSLDPSKDGWFFPLPGNDANAPGHPLHDVNLGPVAQNSAVNPVSQEDAVKIRKSGRIPGIEQF